MNEEPPSGNLPEEKPVKVNIYDCWCEEEDITNPIDYSSYDEYVRKLDLLGRIV